MATTRSIWLATIWLSLAVRLLAGGSTPPEPERRVQGGTPAEAAMVEWAWNRFETTGLVAPSVVVLFGEDEDCNGYAGLYEPGKRIASVCNRGGHINQPRQTLVHELAHAWTIDNLSDVDIGKWLAFEGIERWFSDDPLAWKRGAERAAEIMTWGLQDSADEDRSFWTTGKSCDYLAFSFRALTGVDPINTNPQFCST